MRFFRRVQADLEQQRGQAYARLYVAIAMDDAAEVSRASRAVQDADGALVALADRRRALLAEATAASAAEGASAAKHGSYVSYGPPRSLFDIALD